MHTQSLVPHHRLGRLVEILLRAEKVIHFVELNRIKLLCGGEITTITAGVQGHSRSRTDAVSEKGSVHEMC